MTKEFKKIINANEIRYVLEDASAGATSAGNVAAVETPMGSIQRRLQELKSKVTVPTVKPRNPAGMGTSPGRGTTVHQPNKRQQARDEKKISEKKLDSIGDDYNEGLKDPKDNPCWKGYKPVGTKKKAGRTVPNCVPKEGIEEAAKWRQGYRASGHPAGYKHKSGEVGPLGGTYDTQPDYGDEKKVPVQKHRDHADPLSGREKTKLSTTGKPLLAKNAQKNLKTAIQQSKGMHGPVSSLPEEAIGMQSSYEMMKDKISAVLVRLYDQGKDAETIKQMGNRVAKHLGYDANDDMFQQAWMASFAEANLDGEFDGDDDYTDRSMRRGERGMEEGSEWEIRHDEFVTVGDRATPEQINKIVSALGVAAKQADSKRGFLNQIVGKQSNGELARMAHGAETLAKSIRKNSNAKPGTDERKELGQHLIYAMSLLKRIKGKQGVAEGERTMSRAAKGIEKYGKVGMQALAKAGREGKDLDKVRDKYNKYDEGAAEGFNHEYDDEAGMAHSNLLSAARAVMGLLKTIKDRDNLPEWGQEKIAKAEMMLVGVWDYLQSQKEMGNDPQQDVAEGSSGDLVYISVDSVEAFEDWMDSEGLETNVPKTDKGTYVVYDYTNADGISKMYASEWNEEQGVTEGGDLYLESLAAKLEELKKK